MPTDFVDYLSTTSIFTFANEQELVNHEIGKASPIARYLTTYFLMRDPSLQGDFADELRTLIEHLAGALGVPVTSIDVDIPKPADTAAMAEAAEARVVRGHAGLGERTAVREDDG